MSSYYEKFLATGEVKCIDDEIPFEIPKSWEWSRLGDICSYLHRGKSPKYGEHKFLPIIAQKCNQWDKIYTDRCLFSSKDYIEKYKEEQFVQKGDIIINSTGGGTVGRTGYIDSYVFANFDRFVVDSHVTLVRPICPIASKYIYYFLISPLIQIGLEDRCSGSTNQIELGTTSIANYIIPMPPINEQHRIIGQINKILPLLERYSANQIAQDKLNSEINVRLKKSILQEAIQGRLVPQIAEEGTAQELLEQIRQEKLQLVKDGKLKKSALTDSIIFRGDDNKYFEKVGKTEQDITDEIPFEIPDDWKWCRLGDLVSITSGENLTSKQMLNGEIPVYGGNGVTGYHSKANVFEETIVIGRVGYYCGSIHLTPSQAWVTDNAFITQYSKLLNRDFLIILLTALNLGKCYNATAQPVVSGKRIYPLLIALPPIKEQQRIVAQIEKLFEQLK